MAYTGTGTQSDPFVVTTFADFLECVAQEGVYVEVGADLDAAAEGFGYIEPIDVKAVEVYGTSGDTLRKIANVTVEGTKCLNFCSTSQSPDQYMRWLHLENWTWKCTDSASDFLIRSTNGTAVLKDCKMSASLSLPAVSSATQTSARLQNKLALIGCALILEAHNGVIQPNYSSNQNFNITDTTLRITGYDGAKLKAGTSAADNRFPYCSNAGIILKNIEVQSVTGINGGDGFSYIVLEDCPMPATSTVYAASVTNLVCFAGTTDASGATVTSGTVVTQSQLKDKAYLQSIGWLP